MTKFQFTGTECNRTGTGSNFNLRMRMTVYKIVMITYSQLSISRNCGGLFFTSSNNPNRVIWTRKKSPTPNYGCRKQSKCIFDSVRHFEILRIRDIQVRNIEIDCSLYNMYLQAFKGVFNICNTNCSLVILRKSNSNIFDQTFKIYFELMHACNLSPPLCILMR